MKYKSDNVREAWGTRTQPSWTEKHKIARWGTHQPPSKNPCDLLKWFLSISETASLVVTALTSDFERTDASCMSIDRHYINRYTKNLRWPNRNNDASTKTSFNAQEKNRFWQCALHLEFLISRRRKSSGRGHRQLGANCALLNVSFLPIDFEAHDQRKRKVLRVLLLPPAFHLGTPSEKYKAKLNITKVVLELPTHLSPSFSQVPNEWRATSKKKRSRLHRFLTNLGGPSLPCEKNPAFALIKTEFIITRILHTYSTTPNRKSFVTSFFKDLSYEQRKQVLSSSSLTIKQTALP